MPVLKFTNDEIGTLLHALRTEAGEWLSYRTLHGSAQNINSVSRILKNTQALEARVQEVYDNMTDEEDGETAVDAQITEAEAKRRTAIANMIIAECEAVERVNSDKAPTENTPEPRGAWHRTHGWLHPVEHLKNAAADVEAGEITREDVADALGVDLAEVDAENARDRVRQDQIAPGTWTALPEGFEVDADPYEITDPDEKIVIAAADTQTDGTVVGFYRYDLTPSERHNIKRELQGYDLITWQETVGDDYQGVDSSEHEASVIFVRKNKDDRFEIHPGSDISGEFRKHMKRFFLSRCEYNSFEEVRNLLQERAVAFFKLGGKSLSKRHINIEISIDGLKKTLRGTAGDADRLLKELTAAHRRF